MGLRRPRVLHVVDNQPNLGDSQRPHPSRPAVDPPQDRRVAERRAVAGAVEVDQAEAAAPHRDAGRADVVVAEVQLLEVEGALPDVGVEGVAQARIVLP